MDKLRKLELIQRSLGLRHKLKVHESMKAPDSHEDMAHMLIAKWEFEDEIKAIEEILANGRQANVNAKRALIEREHKEEDAAEGGGTKKKSKK
jgi:hypothetical protein